MYQQALRKYGKFNAIQLSDPAPVLELLVMALKEEDLDSVGNENDDLKMKIAEVNEPSWTPFFGFCLILTNISFSLSSDI